MSMANQKQIGGMHYQAEYQHWDLVIFLSMGYLEGCSTKYVTRWRKAKGIQDLQKGQHYLEKLIEVFDIYDISDNRPRMERIEEEVDKFAQANDLLLEEKSYVYLCASFQVKNDLKEAMQILHKIIEMAEAQQLTMARSEETGPGTPEDGGHYEPL